MAIVNVTPDSFWSGGRCTGEAAIERALREALDHGADIIDIGGYSTRPGAADVPPAQEWERVARAVEVVRRAAPDARLSVDTFRSGVVRKVYENFGRIAVNDITAGRGDSAMVATVAELRLPYIAMHSRGTPATMQGLTHYDDVTAEVARFLQSTLDECRRAGIDDITIDPGFGFAKTTEQNFELLRNLPQICAIGKVLVGLSRKSMIWRTLGITPDEALNGTTALHWEALRGGATTLRVHDVAAAAEIRKLYYQLVCY